MFFKILCIRYSILCFVYCTLREEGVPVALASYTVGGYTLQSRGKSHETVGKQSPRYVMRCPVHEQALA